MTKLIVPENVFYLNKWPNFDLPNGILNKGTTGCGATTLAIENAHKTIVACPRINLVKNKASQHKNVLDVHGKVPNDTIEDYLKGSTCPKILTTYDSIGRLSKLITDKSDWRVIVDEYQYILIDSSFKADIELNLLESLKEFPYVTYLSATPIADKYMKELPYFKDMPYTLLEWKNASPVRVKCVESRKPLNHAVEIVRNYQKGIFPKINDIESKECVIFLNSVNNIVNIIKQTGLKPDEVNIIVGGSDSNADLIKKIGAGFERGYIPQKDEPHKMFTFCTSTAFAGCDFYSTCASTFIISDNKRKHTSIDIATELVQIAGRQRLKSNPFRDVVTLIYNISDKGYDYKRDLDLKLNISQMDADNKNSITDNSLRKQYIKETVKMQNILNFESSYVFYDESNDRFDVNRLAYMSDCFSMEVQHDNYRENKVVLRLLDDNGLQVDEYEKRFVEYSEQLNHVIKTTGFTEMMKEYCEHMASERPLSLIVASLMEQKNKNLKEYYSELRHKRIKALGYKESALKNEIRNRQQTANLYREFREIFKSGDRWTTNCIREKMAEIYAKYGVHRKAVATHLERDFGIRLKSAKVPISNDTRLNGYEFI